MCLESNKGQKDLDCQTGVHRTQLFSSTLKGDLSLPKIRGLPEAEKTAMEFELGGREFSVFLLGSLTHVKKQEGTNRLPCDDFLLTLESFRNSMSKTEQSFGL